MPTYLFADDIADLVAGTQRDLGRLRWTEAASDLQEHVAFSSLLSRERTFFGSGYGLQWQVRVSDSGNAKHAGMYENDQINVGETLTTANAPWRFCTSGYAIDRREIAMNREPAKVVDEVRLRRVDAMVDMAEEIETKFWSLPSSTSADPFGAQYWIVYNATDGFTGGNPSGYTSGPGAINTTTYPRWKNYSFTHSNNMGDATDIRAWRKAASFTKFMSPVDAPEYNTGSRYGWYTTYANVGKMEEYAEAQNDRLGRDIASMDGKVLFRGNPVTWVPYLENVSGDKLYGINWGVMKIAVLSGWHLRETGPFQHGDQHNTLQTHIDLTYQIICYDRRRLVVGASA
jgi:hypothetical protein